MKFRMDNVPREKVHIHSSHLFALANSNVTDVRTREVKQCRRYYHDVPRMRCAQPNLTQLNPKLPELLTGDIKTREYLNDFSLNLARML
jgi:hypothetical protein